MVLQLTSFASVASDLVQCVVRRSTSLVDSLDKHNKLDERRLSSNDKSMLGPVSDRLLADWAIVSAIADNVLQPLSQVL